MSYKNFGKNVTIVLPVPSQDLTFEEYKKAFGIDLQTIDLHDQIMINKDGIVYPSLYVDAGSGVIQTAIGNFDISQGFEIDSESLIQVQAKELIESGEVDNAKPIYCHPIQLVSNVVGKWYRLTFLVFNNDSTPFTYDTFKQWLFNLYAEIGETISIVSSGSFHATLDSQNDGEYSVANRIYTNDGETIKVSGGSIVTDRVNIIDVTAGADNLIDGVNKIN